MFDFFAGKIAITSINNSKLYYNIKKKILLALSLATARKLIFEIVCLRADFFLQWYSLCTKPGSMDSKSNWQLLAKHFK